MPLAATMSTPIASGNSWLITPNVGLTIWTLVVFGISLYILSKAAFPRIRNALDERRRTIEESLSSAQRTREEAVRRAVERHPGRLRVPLLLHAEGKSYG